MTLSNAARRTTSDLEQASEIPRNRHTPLSAVLGGAAGGILIGFVALCLFDGHPGASDRTLVVGATGVLAGLAYVASRAPQHSATDDKRYWDGYAKCARDLLGESGSPVVARLPQQALRPASQLSRHRPSGYRR